MFPQLSIRSTLISLLCVVLSGCMATAPGANNTSEPVKTSDQPAIAADARLTTGKEAEFFSRSGYESCLVAGGGTALVCLALGGKPAKCLIGAVAVCGVAMGANYYLEQRRSEYSDATKRLEAMKADVSEDTKRVAMRTETMRSVMLDDKKRMAELQKSIKAKKADTEVARKDLASIDKNIEVMRKELNGMKTKSSNYAQVLQDEKKGDAKSKGKELANVEAEVKKLSTQVAALEKEIDGAYAQRSAITLG